MPAKKRTSATAPKKKTLAEYRKENEQLKTKLEKIENGAYCYMCDTFKPKSKFYMSTDPMIKSGVTPICKDCAKKIAQRIDTNGEYHPSTRDSLIKALRYLDKPFLETVYNASVQESSKFDGAKAYADMSTCYFKNIAMSQYDSKTFEHSDMFINKIIYEDEKNEDYLKNKDEADYAQYIKDKEDTIRLIGYDPFENEMVTDQPLLYSKLLGMLDNSEDANDDMLRVESIITIVRSFLQISKLDNVITQYMSDYKNLESHAGAIKTLQDSKKSLQVVITNLAAESCISLKNNKTAKKGENTWTGKMKKLKDLNLRDKDVNGFDIETCKGMQQVADISAAAIVKALNLDESEYTEMIKEQREKIESLLKKANALQEASRLLLKENLDLRDYLNEHNMLNEENLLDLDEIVNTYLNTKG